MEAHHDGELVRQHHPSPCFRVSNMEGMRYRIQRLPASRSFPGRIFCCPSMYVSKAHCEIFRRNRTYWVKDVGSINGTYLNGFKMDENCERELRFGDILGLGVSHDETSVNCTDAPYFIFRFQQVATDVELDDDDEENEDDIQIICEVESPSKSANDATSSSAAGAISKPMPPPPPIISKPKEPTPCSSASTSVCREPISRANNSKESTSGKQKVSFSRQNTRTTSNNGSVKSDDDHNKSQHEPKAKRLKITSHSSSDDSSDGLGDTSHPISKSSSGPTNAFRESYSGVSTEESSSSEDDDGSVRPSDIGPEVRSTSPTYKSHKNNSNRNLSVASHSKAKKAPQTKPTARKRTCHVPEHIATKQKLRKLKREAAQLQALKREAIQKPCSVNLTNIIIEKDGMYVVTRKVLEMLKYQAVIKRVRLQFAASFSANKRKQPQHSAEPYRNSGKHKDTEGKSISGKNKVIQIHTLSSSSSSSSSESENENANPKKVRTKTKPLCSSPESDSENENANPKKVRTKTKPLSSLPESDSENENANPKSVRTKTKPLSSLPESDSENENAKPKKVCTKPSNSLSEPEKPIRPRDLRMSPKSISDISDVDLPPDNDMHGETISKQTKSVPPAAKTPVPKQPSNRRCIKVLDNAPLPKFAARAQEKQKAAAFIAPMPPSSFYKSRENGISKSQNDTTVTEREFPYMTKEDQKQARSQKLKEVEMRKQQERENLMDSNNKPKPAAKIKVKVTKRNRNQDLMECIVGEQFKDTDSVVGGVNPNYKSTHTSNSKPMELEAATRTVAANAIGTRLSNDPRVYTKQVEKDINDSMKASTPQPSTSFSFFAVPAPPPRPVIPIIPPKPLQPPPAPIHNGTSRNLKPGAEVILSPPMGVGKPNYRQSENILSSGSAARNLTPRKPHISEHDVYKRICDWNPKWIEEQKNMKGEPPILNPNGDDSNITMTLTTYVNFQDYFNTYYPLLLCEIWASISDSNESKTRRNEENRHSITEYSVKIDNVKISESCPLPFSKNTGNDRDQPVDANQNWATITYHAWTRHEHEINSKRNLLTLVVHGTLKKTKNKICKPMFCFSDFNSERYDRVDWQQGNCDQRLKKKNDPTFRGNGYRFTETLVCKFGTNIVIDTTQIGTIKRHVYLTSHIKEFRALNELQSMKLYNHIVSPPESKTPWKSPSESGPADQHNMISLCLNLNPEQRSMVKHVTSRVFSNEPELMLMHGPPGTGKTKTLVALIMQLLETGAKKHLPPDKQRILVCTPSNAAIDEIMRRLIDAKNNLPAGRKLELLRIGDNYSGSSEPYSLTAKVKAREEAKANTRSLQVELASVENEIEDTKTELNNLKRCKADPIRIDSKGSYLRELEAKKVQLQNDLHPSRKKKEPKNVYDHKKQEVIRDAQIICTTLCSSVNSQLKNSFAKTLQYNQKPFLCCIVDEASQTTEPETLLPLVHNVDKLLLVGDSEQLGATVRSSVAETKGYGQSLFTRLHKFYSKKPSSSPVMMLQRQYRMHPDIAKWPNSYNYGGKLQTVYSPPSSSDRLSFPLRPYYFLNMSSGRQHSKTEGQIENVDEVEMVKVLLDTLEGILSEAKIALSVGIITPYAAQKAGIVKEVWRKSFWYLKSVEVDTVDGFQGQERDIIILSCVRTDGTGFLKSRNRLNVALTRAKHCLYIIGDARNLLQETMWKSLITNAAERNCKYDVNPDFRLNLAVLKDSLTAKLKEKTTD